ncbi:MAG: hypothetical protein WBY44_19505, partial [Bryobacteraceae bacterium]
AGLLGIPTAPTGATGGSAPSYGLLGGGSSAVGGGTPMPAPTPGALPGNLSGGGVMGGLIGGMPGAAPGNASPGAPAGINVSPQAQAAAANLIQGLLTQPRPGGMQGLPGQSGLIMGGGIAGVASKAEGESIMVYADHTDYGEWEFIYDPMKFVAPTNPNTGGGVGTPAQQLGSSSTGPNITNQVGTPVSNIGGGMGGAGGGTSGITNASFGASGAGGAQGAPGSTGTGAPSGGSSGAFGQAGPPDIRPGKQ